MTKIQWRPQVNALTTPPSYRAQVVPHNIAGYNEMAADISAGHPNYNADLIRSLAPLMMEWIQTRMINGDQVTFEDALTIHTTIIGRMDSPDDPLPNDEELLQVKAYASRPFVRKVRREALLERLPMNEKLPLITSAEDTKFKLADVLNPGGVLRLTGGNLFFEEEDPNSGCIIQGTRSGETKQSVFGSVSNTGILLVPDIPAQDDPWNNEYRVSVTTRYTEHGTPRGGTYRRRLRSPLAVSILGGEEPIHVGILTGSGATAYAVITGGTVSADERLRIQVTQDLTEEALLFSLLDMKEEGAAGAEVNVTANGDYSLPGFGGSAVSSLSITVNDYAALWEMIRNDYGGRLVDILEVTV